MAVLKPGSVISATVEQALGNCVLVRFRHGSRTFRGVLFDEKNSLVPRPTLNRASIDRDTTSNTNSIPLGMDSIPLGMAVVAPSRHTYSSLRPRACTLNNSRGTATSYSRVSALRQADNKASSRASVSVATTTQSLVTIDQANVPVKTSKETEQTGMGKQEVRHSCRLQNHKNAKRKKASSGVKRKASDEVQGSKPTKSSPKVQSVATQVVSKTYLKSVPKSRSRARTSRSKKRNTAKASNGSRKEITTSSSEKCDLSHKEETKCIPSVLTFDTDGMVGAEADNNSNLTVRQNLFSPELTSTVSSVFCDEQSENQSTLSLTNGDQQEELDDEHVADFMVSLGLDREPQNESNDKGSDMGLSYSNGSSSKQETSANKEHALNSLESKDGSICSEHDEETVLTPVKKSARISAKRAKLEAKIDEDEGNTTVWSIWGTSPMKKEPPQQSTIPESYAGDEETNVQCTKSQHDNGHVDHENCNHDNTKKTDLHHNNAVKRKGARMKRTLVDKPAQDNAGKGNTEKLHHVSVGSVVWGKVHGHPWWPGRVLAVSGNIGEGGMTTQHAHVTWFGSNTSSIMPVCGLQHFLPNFRKRHKKGKKGCYRTAVRQAKETLHVLGEQI